MHKNRFPALRYANNDRHKRCLIVSKGALVRLTYVASGSVVKCSLNMNNEEKSQNADGMKQNKEGEKGIILFSSIRIYVSPLTSVLRSIECQHAFAFHLQISIHSVKMQFKIKIMKIILIAKSPRKGYKIADQSEQGESPNNNDHRHLIRNHVDKYVITKHYYQLKPLSLATVNLSLKRQGSYGVKSSIIVKGEVSIIVKPMAPGFALRLCPRANKNLHMPLGYPPGNL
ncbi:hypothetical protein T01_7620 [Trichinella spiralis]|uniref:Uncharacterized protein n=1 Tax=Trichinella spiralis TaxID=6334 RepID=A0A0V1BHH4_TRISP|nr:hypothetical protein T01_7620 [Trichinella spiralis]